MRLLVISDLHIDLGDSFGTFKWKPNRFIKVLDTITKHYQIDQVVLNGDVYDLYKYAYNEVVEANTKLVEYFRSHNCYFIRGNHDFWGTSARRVYVIKNSSGQKIRIEHGHDADFLNGTKLGRFIGRTSHDIIKYFIKYKWIERLYHKTVERVDEIHSIPRKYNTYKYLLYALKLLRHYDMVILGHTHKIEVHKMYYANKKKQYLNCGSCSLGRFQGILLDTETLANDIIKLGRKCEFNLNDLPVFPTKKITQELLPQTQPAH